MRKTLVGLVLAGCAGGSATSSAPSETKPAAPPLGTTHVTAPAPAATPVAKPDAVAAKPAEPPAPSGLDFTADAKLLYRIAACGGGDDGRISDEIANGDDKRAAKLTNVVERHCKNILTRIGQFRAAYFEKNRAWFAENVPKDVPSTVVYPFGGGDLISALVAFPEAKEITTISLELAGDPRRLRTIKPDTLEGSLGSLRYEIGGLISVGSNTSVNLSNGQRNELPGQVSSFMMGLVAGGYEPVAMRYFTLDDAGDIHYVEQSDIDAVERDARKKAKSRKGDWASPNFSEAFANVEIQYRKIGDKEIRVHRHIAWNLGDEYLAKHRQLLAHLDKKGKVTILTKGGSYLLQRDNFSMIRGYMLDHLAWMLSDSTGIAPTYAEPAGMIQVTFGNYVGALLAGSQGNRHDRSFVELWRSNPRRKLGFRFGYVDAAGQNHLVITKPAK